MLAGKSNESNECPQQQWPRYLAGSENTITSAMAANQQGRAGTGTNVSNISGFVSPQITKFPTQLLSHPRWEPGRVVCVYSNRHCGFLSKVVDQATTPRDPWDTVKSVGQVGYAELGCMWDLHLKRAPSKHERFIHIHIHIHIAAAKMWSIGSNLWLRGRECLLS